MKPLFCLLLTLCLCPALFTQAQNVPVKYGSISEKDFTLNRVFDTGTAAVVIADVGSTSFEGNTKSSVTMVFKWYRRVKILNKNGFDMANVSIPLYVGESDEEKLVDVKAHTYNLENGKVVETKLESTSVFKDKLNKHYAVKKFTLPAVKEGSIIEYSYTVNSDFYFNMHDWFFQGEYPILWSEYNVKLPQCFDYITLRQGYLPFYIDTAKRGFQNITFTKDGEATTGSHSFTYDMYTAEARWVVKDAPPLKEERFTTTLKNHISRISFQLSEFKEPYEPKKIMGDWFLAAEDLLKNETFGEGLDKPSFWLDGDMKTICAGAGTQLDKARKIYAYVRDNITCTDHSELYRGSSIKEVFNKRNGSVAEVNLLLVTMLRHEGLDADPVILSTRSHGFTYEAYPILDRFNYVICRLKIDDKKYMLDASRDYIGFNRLPEECYNGHSRVVNAKAPEIIYLSADSLVEKKSTSVFISVSDSDKTKMEGSFQSKLGYFESASVRNSIKMKGKDAFFKRIKTSYNIDVDIKNPVVDSITNKDEPLTESYTFTFDKPAGGMLYIDPMMGEGIKENDFKSVQRSYPVEMPCAMDNVYVFNLEVPEGYDVEEIPKSARVSLGEGDGLFEYLVDKAEGHIRLMSHIKLNKATFKPEEYDSLRQWYSYIVKKHAEQIVLKKKK